MLPSNPWPWLSEDVLQFRVATRRFIEGELAPRLDGWRRQGRVPREAWQQAGALGLLLPELPEEWGGVGGTLAHQMVWQEELARAELPVSASVHSIAAHYLLDLGTEEQKRRWLPDMATGARFAGLAMTEPEAGSDLQGIRTSARREGDQYVVSGAKTFITNGATANLMLVVVRTGEGSKGLSILVVETEGLRGYSVGPLLEKLGQKASDTTELFFDEMRIPAANLLGGVEGRGFAQLMAQLPYERTLLAVGAVAIMARALELTVAYTKERKAFGQSLFEFQNTRFKLAECATRAQVARTFVYDCIQRLLDGNLDATAACMAKWWCAEQQFQVLDECLQLFGGYGYMTEYPIARMWADARVQKIYGGTNEIMKEVIARAL
jgi:acyl-CoA dehydrogenase